MSFPSIVLFVISFVGAVYDLRFRRIPNWLTFGTFFLSVLFHLLRLDLSDLFNCILGFFVGILLLIVPYLLGGMGAGDVKLLGAVGSLVGFKEVLLIFIYSGIGGLLLVLIWILLTPKYRKFFVTTGQILPAVDKKEKIPYGIAVFMGTILYIMFGSGNLFNFHLWQ